MKLPLLLLAALLSLSLAQDPPTCANIHKFKSNSTSERTHLRALNLRTTPIRLFVVNADGREVFRKAAAPSQRVRITLKANTYVAVKDECGFCLSLHLSVGGTTLDVDVGPVPVTLCAGPVSCGNKGKSVRGPDATAVFVNRGIVPLQVFARAEDGAGGDFVAQITTGRRAIVPTFVGYVFEVRDVCGNCLRVLYVTKARKRVRTNLPVVDGCEFCGDGVVSELEECEPEQNGCTKLCLCKAGFVAGGGRCVRVPKATPTPAPVCATEGFESDGDPVIDKSMVTSPTHELRCPPGSYPSGIFGSDDGKRIRSLALTCSDGTVTDTAGTKMGESFSQFCPLDTFINTAWAELFAKSSTLRSLKFGCGPVGGTLQNKGVKSRLQMIGNRKPGVHVDFHGCRDGGLTGLQGLDVEADGTAVRRVSFKCCKVNE